MKKGNICLDSLAYVLLFVAVMLFAARVAII